MRDLSRGLNVETELFEKQVVGRRYLNICNDIMDGQELSYISREVNFTKSLAETLDVDLKGFNNFLNQVCFDKIEEFVNKNEWEKVEEYRLFLFDLGLDDVSDDKLMRKLRGYGYNLNKLS